MPVNHSKNMPEFNIYYLMIIGRYTRLFPQVNVSKKYSLFFVPSGTLYW